MTSNTVTASTTFTNTGTSSTTGWIALLTFTSGQQITQIWGGRTNLGSNPYPVGDETWNGANTAPSLTCIRTP